MTQPASEVYEIALDDTAVPKRVLRMIVVFVTNLLSMGSGPMNPGGMIIRVVRRDTGEEVFRHIEDMGDDEGHLLDGIQKDLASMTVEEFNSTWLE